MQIERPRPTVLRVTLSVYEMASLIAAARWAVDDGQGELTAEARRQLEHVLASYDEASRQPSG